MNREPDNLSSYGAYYIEITNISHNFSLNVDAFDCHGFRGLLKRLVRKKTIEIGYKNTFIHNIFSHYHRGMDHYDRFLQIEQVLFVPAKDGISASLQRASSI